jgi:hypothetical protein
VKEKDITEAFLEAFPLPDSSRSWTIPRKATEVTKLCRTIPEDTWREVAISVKLFPRLDPVSLYLRNANDTVTLDEKKSWGGESKWKEYIKQDDDKITVTPLCTKGVMLSILEMFSDEYNSADLSDSWRTTIDKFKMDAEQVRQKMKAEETLPEYEARWNKTTGGQKFSLLVKVSSKEMCMENVS